jgi:predicted esterase
MNSSKAFFLCLLIVCCIGVTRSLANELPSSVTLNVPAAEMPEDGWPSILLLHELGEHPEDYAEFVDLCAAQGVTAIVVETQASSAGSSYTAVEPVLDFIDKDARFDASRVFIGGFSQGAFESLVVGQRYPQRFAGILAMSPNADAALPIFWGGFRARQSLYVMMGSLDSSAIHEFVGDAVGQWTHAGQRATVRQHLGKHQLPKKLATELRLALDWLLMRGVDGC